MSELHQPTGSSFLRVALVLVAILGLVAATAAWEYERARQRLVEKALEAQARSATQTRYANERTAIALDAIQRLISAPGMPSGQREFDQAILARLGQLSDSANLDPGADVSTVIVHLMLGDVYDRLRDASAARTEWMRAIEKATAIMTLDHYDYPSTVIGLARTHVRLSSLHLRLDDLTVGAEQLEIARSLLEQARVFHEDCFTELADVFSQFGEACLRMHRIDESLQYFEQSLKLRLRFVVADPSSLHARSELAQFHDRIGQISLSRLHDYIRAEWHFREQLLVAGEQLAQRPEDATWQRRYMLALLNLSSALQRQCEFKGAESTARDAVAWFEQAAANDADNASAKRDLANALDTLGSAQLGEQQFVEAESSFTRAYERLKEVSTLAESAALVASEMPQICYKLALVSERLGKYSAAETWVECMEDHLRNLAAPEDSLTPTLLGRLLATRQALGLAPQALADRELAFGQPDAIVEMLAPLRSVALARNGDYAAARQEAVELQRRLPASRSGPLSLAFVDSIAATQSTDDAEQTRLLESATAAMLDALRMDPTLADTLHLFPELVPLRSFAPFQQAFEERVRAAK